MKKLAIIICVLLISAIPAIAVEVEIDFAFTASVSTDVIGYNLYARDVTGGSFDTQWEIQNLLCDAAGECTFTLTADLDYGTYAFVSTAFNSELESRFSDETEPFEVVQSPPPATRPEPPTGLRTVFQKIIVRMQDFFERIFSSDRGLKIVRSHTG